MAQGRKPDYNATVTTTAVDADGNQRKSYVIIGAAWDAQTQNGVPCVHVKLNAKPWGDWDGSFSLYRTPG